MGAPERDFIAILDFGGQYAHLIAKRIRHLGVYALIFPPTASLEELRPAKGIVLSGGPQSVFGEGAIAYNPALFSLPQPLLGLCYGHQLMAHALGGKVERLGGGEYGKAAVALDTAAARALLEGVPAETEVWMSHGDTVVAPPPGFAVVARTPACPVAAMADTAHDRYGLQWHPEVTDTPHGTRMLANFVTLTGVRRSWNMATYMRETLAACREQVGARNVLMFLSGGVDSTVAFALLSEALGPSRVRGLFIDNGFMRKNEPARIRAAYEAVGFANVDYLDASAEFLAAVAGLTDPQAKRQAVGETFVRVRESYLAAQALDPEQWLLGQGTLYPDIIESGGTAHAQVIKFHHNRVELIQALLAQGHVVEPLAELYKDEVRLLGAELGLPEALVWRHPFPGPGLSINVLCATGRETFPENAATAQRLTGLLAESGYAGAPLPVRSVGVQGDARTYTPPVALSGPPDWERLEALSTRITNDIAAVNRVVYLLGPQPTPTLRPREAYCTADRLHLLREADALASEALERAGLMRDIFQLLVILLPLSPDGRGDAVVLRPVVSEDVMTARFARLPWPLLAELTPRLLDLRGVAAVFYDVTHKPPATFGWE